MGILPHRRPSNRLSVHNSGPAFSMRSRVLFGSSQPQVTSKDARPEITSKDVHKAIRFTMPRQPAFSIVSRSHVNETNDHTRSPGPQRYSVPQIISNLRHPLYRMPAVKGFAGSERTSEHGPNTPGPGQYQSNPVVCLKRSPSYGFRSREGEGMSSALTPDCGAYNVGNIVRSGKVWRGPSWSMGGRPRDSRAMQEGDGAISIVCEESTLLRVLIDTSGSSKMHPVPYWSFPKSRRFV